MVDKTISLAIVTGELDYCRKFAERYGWEISELNEASISFRVKLTSPIDMNVFIAVFRCDNYREWPPHIDFVDPNSGEIGSKKAYPVCNGGFFHQNALICHPCSRKAYGALKGPHGDWDMVGWEDNPKTGALKNILGILLAIYGCISQSEAYRGRMG